MTADSGRNSTVPTRRDRSAAGRRPTSVLIRLTAQERDALASRAATQGITVQRYLLECAAAVQEPDGMTAETRSQRNEFVKELMGLRRLLANVANNVNQIAKVAHTEGLIDAREQATANFAVLRRVSDRLYDLIDSMLPKR